MRSTITAALLAALALAAVPSAVCGERAARVGRAGAAVGPSSTSSAPTARDGGKARLGECRELAVPTARTHRGPRVSGPRRAVRLDVPMAFQHFELEHFERLLRRGAGVAEAGCETGCAASTLDAAAGAPPRVTFSLPAIAL